MLIHFSFLIGLQLLFFSYEPVTTTHIRNLVLSSSKLTCLSDPIPSKLLPYCVDVTFPVVLRITNLSHSTGIFPNDLKSEFVKPLLEKTALDSNDITNYRPISNLSFLSKLIERVIANQLHLHLSSNGLRSEYRSEYHKFYTSETALLRIQNEILVTLDYGHSTALLPLLDLSAAFDTIDHNIQFHRLKHWFGITSSVLSSLSLFLANRFETVVVSSSPLHSIISKNLGFRCHFYADDT